jgi:hypothetical protein
MALGNKLQHIAGENLDIQNIVCQGLRSTYKFISKKHNLQVFLEIKFDERTFDIHNSEQSLNTPNRPHYSEFNFIDQHENCLADEIAELIFAITKFAKEKLAEAPVIEKHKLTEEQKRENRLLNAELRQQREEEAHGTTHPFGQEDSDLPF